jgi:hypothetical protein
MNAIRESLQRFLTDDELRVAILKGAWGSGKTFFWRSFLDGFRAKLSFRAYSYVSMFGVQSAADLERHVFLNLEVLDHKKMGRHLEKLKPVAKLLKAVDLPYLKSGAAVLELVESKLVENVLICFDDFERKECGITPSSILGIISKLSQEKRCKILLIYNDEKLDEAAARAISEYREKVVDLELTYSPTIQENLNIIWPENCPESVAQIFTTLELNNIRIMQRVKWAQSYFAEVMQSDYCQLHDSFAFKAAALTILYHGFSAKISLDEVLSRSYLSAFLSKDDAEKQRFKMLEKIQFYPEEQDQIIADYLVHGYVDLSRHREFLAAKNDQKRVVDINEKHRQVWQKFYGNFQVPQDQFIKEQSDFLQVNWRDLHIRDVAHTVKFLHQLDSSCNLTGLLDESVDLFVSRLDHSFDLHELDRLGVDPDVVGKIQDRLAQKSKDYSIAELLLALAGSNGWNPSDLRRLVRFTEDDFLEWMKTESNDNALRLIKRFLERFGQTAEAATVIERMTAALECMKTRSVLDRFRAEYIEQQRAG